MSAPLDLPALKLAQDAHLTLGDAANMRDCVGRVLPFWSEGEKVPRAVVGGWICPEVSICVRGDALRVCRHTTQSLPALFVYPCVLRCLWVIFPPENYFHFLGKFAD